MSSALDDAIVERIGFLKEQLDGEDDPSYIRTWQAQIHVLETAQLDRLAELIQIRKTDLQQAKNVVDADRIFAELDALEWMQRLAQKRQ